MPAPKSPLLSRRRILSAAGVAAGAAATSALGIKGAFAAGYPDRPIKIIVPFAPAGPTDIMARILAQSLGPALGGNIIVENRPGAGGNIGIGYVAHAEAEQVAAPDGGAQLLQHAQFDGRRGRKVSSR